MARVQIAPQESPALAWLRRWVPNTRRGWALVGAAIVAPAVPILALLAWMLSQPLLSPATLWQWAMLRTQSAAQTGAAWLLEMALSLDLVDHAGSLLDAAQAVPNSALGGALAFLAVATIAAPSDRCGSATLIALIVPTRSRVLRGEPAAPAAPPDSTWHGF